MPARRTALAIVAVLPLALAAGAAVERAGVLQADPPGVAAPQEVLDAGASAARIRDALDAILAEPDLPPAYWGVYVRDLATGRAVYARNAGRLFLPASNLKLVTTAAALDAFGPAHRFATRLYVGGETTADGTIRGDLVVRGAGDPTFGSRSSGDDPFEAWARALAEAGVRRIEGRLVGDDDVVEDAPWAEGWDVSHVTTEAFAQGVGGLSWGDNLVAVRVRGRAVETDPPGFAVVDGPTGSGGLRVARRLGSNVLDVRGQTSGTATRLVPIEQPTRFALHAFRRALEDAGIALAVELVDADELAQRPDYAALGAPVLAHLSPPLAEIVGHTNRRSDNFYAEQLFRLLAPDGTADTASDRVEAFLEAAGAETEGLSIRDGSGLSRKDLVTPRALVALLAHMDRHPARAVFAGSLPAGGAPGSTLGRRLSDVEVRAKTGSLDYVRALSGYVTGPDGHRLAFSVIANNYTTGGRRIVDAVDRIVRALATGQRVPPEAAADAAAGAEG
jgi:D-alanyl-D-alanine carboxypeptidase/D-alanyl-D-alanine-endopeptidase (penicillin-binding protein 4)